MKHGEVIVLTVGIAVEHEAPYIALMFHMAICYSFFMISGMQGGSTVMVPGI